MHFSTAIAVCLPFVAVLALPQPQATTTAPFSATRPTGVGGFFETFTFAYPSDASETREFASGRAAFTTGVEGGYIGGGAFGGNAPHATGSAGIHSGNDGGAINGGISPTKARGCAGGHIGSAGETICLPPRSPQPTQM